MAYVRPTSRTISRCNIGCLEIFKCKPEMSLTTSNKCRRHAHKGPEMFLHEFGICESGSLKS